MLIDVDVTVLLSRLFQMLITRSENRWWLNSVDAQSAYTFYGIGNTSHTYWALQCVICDHLQGCHPTQVNVPHFNPRHRGRPLLDLLTMNMEGWKGELSPWWYTKLVYLPTNSHVPDLEYFCWSTPTGLPQYVKLWHQVRLHFDTNLS